jgi:hypothetical protein
MGPKYEDLGKKAALALDPMAAKFGNVSGATDDLAKTIGTTPAAALDSFKRQAQLKLAAVTGSMVQFGIQNQSAVKPLVMGLGAIAAVILTVRAGQIAWTAATTAWSAVTAVATGVQWLYNAAMAANPMVWIVIAIVALIVVIVLIATKTTWFQKIWHAAWGAITGAAKGAWSWIKKNWPLILGILTGPIGLAVLLITKKWNSITSFFSKAPGRIGKATMGLFDGLKNAFRSAVNFIIGGWNRLHFGIPSIDTHIPGIGKIGGGSFGVPQIPYLAAGGHIMAGGMAVVGERGPEALYLPTGATVAPLTRGGSGGTLHVVIDLPGESDLLRANRKMVRVYGRGDVQVAFGTG